MGITRTISDCPNPSSRISRPRWMQEVNRLDSRHMQKSVNQNSIFHMSRRLSLCKFSMGSLSLFLSLSPYPSQFFLFFCSFFLLLFFLLSFSSRFPFKLHLKVIAILIYTFPYVFLSEAFRFFLLLFYVAHTHPS